MTKAIDSHWMEAKKIFRYFSRTINHGILIRNNNTFQISAFIGSD